MNKFLVIASLCLVSVSAHARNRSSGGSRLFTPSYSREVYVHSYARSTGSVKDHFRTGRDGTQFNNWSSKPNVNPYTGKRGTITPTH